MAAWSSSRCWFDVRADTLFPVSNFICDKVDFIAWSRFFLCMLMAIALFGMSFNGRTWYSARLLKENTMALAWVCFVCLILNFAWSPHSFHGIFQISGLQESNQKVLFWNAWLCSVWSFARSITEWAVTSTPDILVAFLLGFFGRQGNFHYREQVLCHLVLNCLNNVEVEYLPEDMHGTLPLVCPAWCAYDEGCSVLKVLTLP